VLSGTKIDYWLLERHVLLLRKMLYTGQYQHWSANSVFREPLERFRKMKDAIMSGSGGEGISVIVSAAIMS
jgi:hypothetical protein